MINDLYKSKGHILARAHVPSHSFVTFEKFIKSFIRVKEVCIKGCNVGAIITIITSSVSSYWADPETQKDVIVRTRYTHLRHTGRLPIIRVLMNLKSLQVKQFPNENVMQYPPSCSTKGSTTKFSFHYKGRVL